jgi:hypothetical protein
MPYFGSDWSDEKNELPISEEIARTILEALWYYPDKQSTIIDIWIKMLRDQNLVK